MIVLHTTKYGDTSLVVHAYTRERGRESFLLRGAAPAKAGGKKRHPTALLHPLSLIDVTVSDHTPGTLRYIREFTPSSRVDSLRTDISKNAVATFISEFLYRTLTEAMPDTGLYDFIEDAIVRLNGLGRNCANFHIWFLIRFSQICGFSPLAGADREFTPFNRDEEAILEQFAARSFEDAMDIPLNGAFRSGLCDTLVSYVSCNLGLQINILSTKVLHAVMAGK